VVAIHVPRFEELASILAVSVVAILVPRFEELGSILTVSVVAILVPRFKELGSILAVSVVGLDYVRVVSDDPLGFYPARNSFVVCILCLALVNCLHCLSGLFACLSTLVQL
jgi:hypothetical protein